MAQQKKKRRRNRHDPNRAKAAAQREEAKRRQREERRKAARIQERKDRWRALLKRWGRLALTGAAVVAVAFLLFRPDPELEGVAKIEEIHAFRLAADEQGEYTTSTPTSGNYREDAQACGIFDQEITTELAATDIFYGAVVLWYSPDLPAEEYDALVAAASVYDDYVVVSPQEGLESPIVATAWNRKMAYDSTDGVDEFLEIYRKRGPGDGPCPMSG